MAPSTNTPKSSFSCKKVKCPRCPFSSSANRFGNHLTVGLRQRCKKASRQSTLRTANYIKLPTTSRKLSKPPTKSAIAVSTTISTTPNNLALKPSSNHLTTTPSLPKISVNSPISTSLGSQRNGIRIAFLFSPITRITSESPG